MSAPDKTQPQTIGEQVAKASIPTVTELPEAARLARETLAQANHRFTVAVAMAPAFRDKFDFSEPEHFDKLADMAYKAADALIAKRDKEAKK